jgi:hypothetical protein
MQKLEYNFPCKVKKFNIVNPILKFFVAKYENKIPWQSVVKSEAELDSYIKNHLYTELIQYATNSNLESKSFFYKYSKTPDVKFLIEFDNEFSEAQIKEINQQLIENGNVFAAKLVEKYINNNKVAAFQLWINLLKTKYPNKEAFHYMVLLPVFELYGKNQRRILPKPDINSIEVLYKRISNELLNPNKSIAKTYFNRVATKYHVKIINTWKFVTKGKENSNLLSSLAYKSGWCIASSSFAENYIKNFDFLILYDSDIPVVAIRCDLEKKIIHEIRGRNNAVPYNWLNEIYLLLNHLKFDISTILLLHAVNINGKDENWWHLQLKRFPLLINNSPYPNFSDKINVEEIDFNSYLNLYSMDQIIIDCNLDEKLDFSNIIKSSPNIFEKLKMSSYYKGELSEELLIDSWLDLVFDHILSEDDLKAVPTFVLKSERFQKALKVYFPDGLKKLTTKRPKNYSERSFITELNDYIIETIDEPFDIAIHRNVQLIINHDNHDFSDIFTPISRKRNDFKTLRAAVWKKAIEIDVTFYFAYPRDLQISEPLVLGSLDLSNPVNKKHLDSLKLSPWLLNRRSGGVPKKLRFTKEMLDGYIKGWGHYITKEPYKIYIANSYGSRTYMSYAALNNFNLIKSFIRGFAQNDCHQNASYRMFFMPVFQFAVLLGYIGKNSFPDVRRKIREIRDDERRNYTKNSIDKAVTEMLINNELKIQKEFYKCVSNANKFGFTML